MDILEEMRSNESLELKRKLAFDNTKKYGLSYLKFLDEQNINKAHDIYSLGLMLLNGNYVTNNIDYYRLIERIVIASLELNKMDTCTKYVHILRNKFGKNSIRVRILLGMYHEKNGHFDEALKYYNNILSVDPNNINAMKRKIAMSIDNNDYKLSIKQLNEYLSIYCNDKNAWKQLLSLYMKINNYEYAKFCCEELILLHGNNNYQIYNKYADILYNMGYNRFALKYYSQSLLISDDKNTRSLWGIIMSLKKIKYNDIKLDATQLNLMDKTRDKIMKNYADTMFADEIKSLLLDLTKKTQN